MIKHVLAVVPVTDIGQAREWYQRLVGREPDNNPMDSLIEWQLADHGWLQVTVDAKRAGTAMVNFAVDDLRAQMGEIKGRGITTGEIQPVAKGVELLSVCDPDGNAITYIGSFREVY
jgi:glyoxylase I family protein